MIIRFIVAAIIYASVALGVVMVQGGLDKTGRSFFILMLANAAAILLSWVAYYFISAQKDKPSLPSGVWGWFIESARVFVGFVSVLVTIYLSFWLSVTHIVLAMTAAVFWCIMVFTVRPMKNVSMFNWIVVDVIMAAITTWAVVMNAHDPTGFSFLITLPIYTVVALLLIIQAVVLVKSALGGNGRQRIIYTLGAYLILAPIVFVFAYASVIAYLSQAASERAVKVLDLPEAQRLLDECKVDTLYRNHTGDARMKLREKSNIPGIRTQDEMRTIKLEDFDQILQFARDGNVQSRCGYIPTYDINRVKIPPANSWVTVDEAKAIICTRSWLVHLYFQMPYPSFVSQYLNGSGILLSKQASVWNNDEELNLYLINVSDDTRKLLYDTMFYPQTARCN